MSYLTYTSICIRSSVKVAWIVLTQARLKLVASLKRFSTTVENMELMHEFIANVFGKCELLEDWRNASHLQGQVYQGTLEASIFFQLQVKSYLLFSYRD